MRPRSETWKVGAVLLLAGVGPWLVSEAAHAWFGIAPHVNERLHAGTELAGGALALSVALLLLLRARQEAEPGPVLWIVAALVSMGVMDGAHSVATFGAAWSWLRHTATLAGGVLFAAVWVTPPRVLVRRSISFIFAVAALSVAWSLAIWWRPDWLPAAWASGEYSVWVIAANGLGGLGFLAAALFFIRRYLRQPQAEDLVFAAHTLLFGVAGVLFGFSTVWAADWWVWHWARLTAYTVILAAAYTTVTALYDRIGAHAQELRETVQLRTAQLEFRNAELAAEIAGRKRLEDDLEKKQIELQALFDNSNAGLVLFDATPPFTVLAHNRYYQELFPEPFRTQGMVGKNVYEYAPAVEAQGVVAVFEEVLRTGKSVNLLDFPYDSHPPEKSWFNWHLSPVIQDGEVVALASLSINVTGQHLADAALRESEARYREANAQLAEADRQKDEFIAVLSHELRNPLAPILYALPQVERERLDERGTRALSVIQRQLDHLTHLVDDLLDVSRITHGKIELRREFVTLASVVAAGVEAASPAIAAAQHTVRQDLPEAPVWLHGDPKRLAQVVGNLLNNSAKYTPKGGEIALEAQSENGGILIRVRDNGTGIPQEALPAVFDMFRQVSRSERSQGGLGIGLALVKRLVEMHGGSVEARSEGAGRGAEFLVRLPAAPDVGTPQLEEETSLPAAGRRLRVLIVDDNADLVEMLAEIVAAVGHVVRKAGDGRSAVSAAVAFKPDVVLLDLGLPGMSGLEVAQELRRRAETAASHLVALTGWGQEQDRRATEAAGFDRHLTKPTSPSVLRRLLGELAAERES